MEEVRRVVGEVREGNGKVDGEVLYRARVSLELLGGLYRDVVRELSVD